MKKLLLAASLLLNCYSFTQTTIWTEDFENSCAANCAANGTNTGNGPWTLTENSPALDGCGFTNTPNVFYVSCAENGNAAGMCGSVCANDESLHIGAGTVGDMGASYDSGGWCSVGLGGWGDGTTTDARIESPVIDLTGETNPTINFNYMENGDGAIDDASLWYFDGTTWTQIDPLAKTAMCGAQGTWTAFSIALPASANNNPNVRIAFLWVNNDDATGTDPSFAVDDITITVPTGASNTITTLNTITPTSWCEGSIITTQVDFTSTGTFLAGNVYTAQLSDALGSFAAPLDIGTLTSTANNGMISATIPGSVLAGTGYRIRVTSSNPATIGSNNGSDLVVNTLPTVTQQPFADICEGASPLTLAGGSPNGGSYSGTGVSTGIFNPGTAGQGTTNITYTYFDGNGCSNSVIEPILVLATPTVTQQPFADLCENASSLTLTGASPSGGIYSGTGVSGGVFDPSIVGAGSTSITYTYSDVNGCSNSVIEPILILTIPTITQQPFADICEDASPLTLTGGSPAGGLYTGTGVSTGTFNPGIAGQGTTTITYTYTDGNGCSNSADQPIIVIALPTVTQQPFIDVCEGGGVINLVGASPAGGTYSGTGVTGVSFDPTVAGLGSTNITYIYTDGSGCTNSVVEPVLVIASPTVTMIPLIDACVYDPSFTLSGGSPAGGVYTGPGVTGGVFDPAAATAGTHTISYTFTDVNGCPGQAIETIFVDGCSGIDENGLNNLVLYPNPASGSFKLISEYNIESVQLLDMNGRLIKSFKKGVSYDISDVSSGVYFVTIKTTEQTSQLRIVVE